MSTTDIDDVDGADPIGDDDTLNEVVLRRHLRLNLTGRVKILDRHPRASGGNCDIYYGHLEGTNATFVAIRRPRFSVLGKNPNFIKRASRELHLWSRLDHRNVVPLCGFLDEGCIYPSLITPWMTNGNARQYINKIKHADVTHLALGISAGIVYLHRRNIVHADLKAENVLVSHTGCPMVADFGLSRLQDTSDSYYLSATSSNVKGSLRWMAFEQLDSQEAVYTKKTDVWAYAMTVYELLTRGVPYSEFRMDAQVIRAILAGKSPQAPAKLHLRDGKERELWARCQLCWNADPMRRPSMLSLNKFINVLSNQGTDTVTSLAFGNFGTELATGAADGVLRIISTGEDIPGQRGGSMKQLGSVTCIEYWGHWLASGSSDGSVMIWDKETSKLLYGPLVGHTGPVTSLAILYNCNFIASGSSDGTIRHWTWTGMPWGYPIQDHTDGVTSLCTFGNDNVYLASGSFDGTTRIRKVCRDDVSQGCYHRPLQTLTEPCKDCVAVLAISSLDYGRVVTGRDDGGITIWHINSGTVLQSLSGHTNEVLAFGHGIYNQFCSVSSDGSVCIWQSEAYGKPFHERHKRVIQPKLGKSLATIKFGYNIASPPGDFRIHTAIGYTDGDISLLDDV